MSARLLGPDEHQCRRCGAAVIYAEIKAARQRVAFDAKKVPKGGYELTEEVQHEQPTGEWIATYTKVADRDPRKRGYRKHSCEVKLCSCGAVKS